MMDAGRKFGGWGALAALSFVLLAGIFGPRFVQAGAVSPFTNPADFRAFYCSGDTVARGGDADRIEPLRSCEDRLTVQMGLQPFPGIVIPAPLPPYALDLFALVSLVPYANAVCAWFALLLVATIATAILLRKETGSPLAVTTGVVTLCAFDAMLLGQIMPLIVALVIVAARALARGRTWLAAGTIALSMIEPHLMLPAFVALALFRRDLRLPLAACTMVLVLPSIVFSGVPAYLEYFHVELPLQAMSEIHSLETQYSLTTFIAMFCGVPDAAALRIGQLDYFATLALSLLVAKRLSDRLADARLLLYVPVAFTVFGGMYVHLYDFAIVIPAALVLATASHGAKALGYWATAVAIGVSSIADAAWGEDLTRHAGPAPADLAALGPHGYASDASRLMQTAHMPHDPHAVAAIVAIKLPALIGVFALIALATGDAFARTARRPELTGLRADLMTRTLRT